MKLRLFSFFAISMVFASCGLFSDRRVDLPATPILTGGSGWVIVKSSYVRLKEQPALASPDVAALRDGTEAEMTGREFDASGLHLWCHLRVGDASPGAIPGSFVEGWVEEKDLEFHASKAQADRALRERVKK